MAQSFLVHLYAAYFDPENPEMRKFTHLSRSDDPHFSTFHKVSITLLAKKVHRDAPLQIIIP